MGTETAHVAMQDLELDSMPYVCIYIVYFTLTYTFY